MIQKKINFSYVLVSFAVAILPQPDNDLEDGIEYTYETKGQVAILPQPDNDLEAIQPS